MPNDKRIDLRLHGKTVLVTGGTGSLGKKLVFRLLKKPIKKVIIYSRDEHKQIEMEREIQKKRCRYILGDIRDFDALNRVCRGVDIVIHTAALKHVPKLEYSPFEAVKTNILGAQNIIDAAISNRVDRVLAVSTDKAVNPINLYGATKLCSDYLFTTADAYAAGGTLFAVVRFGNFIASRGSVIPLWEKQKKNGEPLTVTDGRMTRFFIDIDTAIDRIFRALRLMRGGEIFCPKMVSVKLIDLARSMSEKTKIIGVRRGEKLHEDMVTKENAERTFELDGFYITTDIFRGAGKKVPQNFSYSSDKNWEWAGAEILE